MGELPYLYIQLDKFNRKQRPKPFMKSLTTCKKLFTFCAMVDHNIYLEARDQQQPDD